MAKIKGKKYQPLWQSREAEENFIKLWCEVIEENKHLLNCFSEEEKRKIAKKRKKECYLV